MWRCRCARKGDVAAGSSRRSSSSSFRRSRATFPGASQRPPSSWMATTAFWPTRVCSRPARGNGRTSRRFLWPSSTTPCSPAMRAVADPRITAANTAGVEISEIDTDRDRARRSWKAGPATSSSPSRSPATASGPGLSAPISPRCEVGDEIIRVWVSAAIGLVLLAVALVAAVVMGKRLSRPIKEIAAQAHLVADLELDG